MTRKGHRLAQEPKTCQFGALACRYQPIFYSALAAALSLSLGSCANDAPNAMVTNSRKATTFNAPNPNSLQVLSLSPAQQAQIALSTVKVERCTLPVELQFMGQVEPDPNMTTPVISLVPGRIEGVDAQLGDNVSQGEKLAHLRSDEVAQIEADLLKEVLEIDAEIAQCKVEMSLAKKIYDRHSQLFSEGISARADVDKALSDYEKQQAEMQSLLGKRQALTTSVSERLRLFGAEPHEVQRLLKTEMIDNTFDVVAPRKGVITSRVADVGQLIDNVHELFVVSDLTRVFLMAQVFEKDIKQIKLGQPVTVTVTSYPGKIFRGKVDYVGSNLDPQTRTLPIRATVLNPEIILKPQMFAKIRVLVGTSQVLAAPAEAVQKTGEVYVTYLKTGPNSFEERKVEIGKQYGSQIEILNGLAPGNEIVAHGSLALQGKALQNMSE